MTAALVTALTCVLAYVTLAGCAPALAEDLSPVYAVLITGAWLAIARRLG